MEDVVAGLVYPLGTQFDHLNDDCIRLVLLNFGLSELMFFRSVCARWNIVIETIFRCKKSLKVFANVDCMVNYFMDLTDYNMQDDQYYCLEKDQPDELVGKSGLVDPDGGNGNNAGEGQQSSVPMPQRPNCAHLTRLLPGLTKLIVVQDRAQSLMPLLQSLVEWEKLEHLTLFNVGPVGCNANSPVLSVTLNQVINTMPHLKRLEFFRFVLNDAEQVNSLELVLGQMERFALGNCSFPEAANNIVGDFVAKLNPLRLKDLVLCKLNLNSNQFQNLFAGKANDLLQRLTSLTVVLSEQQLRRHYRISQNVLEYVCNNFPALTFFQHSHTSTTEIHEELFPKLVRLRNLAEFKLFWHISERRLIDETEHITSEERDSIRRLAMPSVRKLQLSVSRIVAHEPVILLADFFPFLEELTICSLSPETFDPFQPDNNQVSFCQRFPSVNRWDIYSLAKAEDRFFGPFDGRRQFSSDNARVKRFTTSAVMIEHRRRLTYSFVYIRELLHEQLHLQVGREIGELFEEIQNRVIDLPPIPMPPLDAEFRPRAIYVQIAARRNEPPANQEAPVNADNGNPPAAVRDIRDLIAARIRPRVQVVVRNEVVNPEAAAAPANVDNNYDNHGAANPNEVPAAIRELIAAQIRPRVQIVRQLVQPFLLEQPPQPPPILRNGPRIHIQVIEVPPPADEAAPPPDGNQN